MGFLTWFGSTVIGQFFKGLFDSVLAGIERKRADDAPRQAGQLEQKATDQQAAIDAQKRMQDAGAQPSDDATTKRSLNDGTF